MIISTHILDTMSGMPAFDVPVALEMCRQESLSSWVPIEHKSTDLDGRCKPLCNLTGHPEFQKQHDNPSPLYFKLTFDVKAYFQRQGIQDPFYPLVEVTWRANMEQSHYHIPLLLNPYSYTTYRGS